MKVCVIGTGYVGIGRPTPALPKVKSDRQLQTI